MNIINSLKTTVITHNYSTEKNRYKNNKRQSRKKKCIFVFIGEAKTDCNLRNNKANK